MKFTNNRPSIGMTTKCGFFERDEFEKLCKKYGVTIAKGLLLLVRLAINKGSLPISHDYENIEHLHKQPIPDNATVYDIIKFIQLVDEGSITDADGSGYISDGENMLYKLYCNANWLTDQAKYYKYVCWFSE